MSFEKEWAQLRAESAQRQKSHTRLDHVSGGDKGSGGKKLHVTPGLLKNRAGKVGPIRDNFRKADDETMKETGQVKDGLQGFASAAAFSTFQSRWRKQMTHMDGLLDKGVAEALRTASKALAQEDADQAGKYGKKK